MRFVLGPSEDMVLAVLGSAKSLTQCRSAVSNDSFEAVKIVLKAQEKARGGDTTSLQMTSLQMMRRVEVLYLLCYKMQREPVVPSVHQISDHARGRYKVGFPGNANCGWDRKEQPMHCSMSQHVPSDGSRLK